MPLGREGSVRPSRGALIPTREPGVPLQPPRVRGYFLRVLWRSERVCYGRKRQRIGRLAPVEGFFAKLTKRRLKRGVFRSVVDLQEAINRFIAETNSNPRPFVWTADPTRVLAGVARGKQSIH